MPTVQAQETKRVVEPIVQKTVILGAGGGYDIYSCIPWYLRLSPQEQNLCILANYSFSDDIYRYDAKDEYIVEITDKTPLTKKNQDYFPEYQLSKFLRKPVYAVRLLPNPTLENGLLAFVIKHKIQRIILVDGGIDLCLFGNESSLGSPAEDSQTFLACLNVSLSHNIPFTIIGCAFGVDSVSTDTFQCNWSLLDNNTSEIINMTRHNCDFDTYKQLLDESKSESIIQCSLLAAMEGHRGVYVNPRLKHKIKPDSCMPDLTDKTLWLWKVDGFEYFHKSPFYQFLQAQKQHKMDAHAFFAQQPERNWLLWSEMIDNAINGFPLVKYVGVANASIVVLFL